MRSAQRGLGRAAIWCEPARGLALGHRRLKSADQSEGDASLEPHEIGRSNGEIYNHLTQRELEGLGHRLPGPGDAEVVLAALQQWGFEECLERFDGMFALAAWQRQTGQLFLARDRLGEKPLYYGWIDGDLVFASILLALRQVPNFSRVGRSLLWACICVSAA
ncbi:MAG: hypothetical protein U0931_38645 [Vulcanimicrobiota bacterium]